jgi:hypothetical protein
MDSQFVLPGANRLGAPKRLIARMMANTLLDTAVGSVPRRHMERRGLTCPKGPIIHGKAVPTG